jgi:hypothetical protein
LLEDPAAIIGGFFVIQLNGRIVEEGVFIDVVELNLYWVNMVCLFSYSSNW